MSQQRSKINFDWANPYYTNNQGRYDNIYRSVGVDLSNPEDLSKKRKKGYTSKDITAMQNLSQIVGSKGRKDIKRINELVDPNSANEWIRKRGLQGLYTVGQTDVDRDGIDEIVVKDVAGNLVVVNGYTIRNSDLPYRQKFYAIPKETRDEMRADYKERGEPFGYKQWVRDEYYGPEYDGEGVRIVGYRGRDPKDDEFTKTLKAKQYKLLKPRNRTPYQAFSIRFVKPLYDFTLLRHRLLTATGGKPNIYVKVLASAWNHIIVMPALTAIYNNPERARHIIDEEPELLAKLKKTNQFKVFVGKIISDFFKFSNQANNDLIIIIHEITGSLANEWFEQHPEVEKCEGFGEEDETVPLPDLTNVAPENLQPNVDISNNDEAA